ncbi:DUF6383 domain-containing protein [uncultured Parabacteroides sp.]|uniref:DUF6383 domain-containing protein n=1 Tax=uncultured Parabacteroides sp. TaxID=512312 RepID=UPI00259B1F55|nr:DUF6383 domain-containing protein [uncultured Parabacteroides sp.]
MNKKFSTLVASLLLAGAWTTADAKLIVPTDGPVVGKSYVVGVSADAATGEVTGLLSADMTIDADNAAALTEFGDEWTLEAASVDGVDDAFYLKNAEGKYLGAGSAWYLDLKDKKDDAYAFYYDAVENKAKLAKTYSENAAKDFYLSVIDAEDKIAVASATHTALTFTSFTAPSELTNGGSLIESVGSDYYFLSAGDETEADATLALKYDATDGTAEFVTLDAQTKAEDYDPYLWKVSVNSYQNGLSYTFTSKVDGKKFVYAAETNYKNGFNSAALEAVTGLGSETIFGLYQSASALKTKTELNAILYEGFNVTIKKGKDDKTVISGTDVFAGKLKAVNGTATRFQLQNEDGDFIVLDKTETWGAGNVGANKRGAKFITVDADELNGSNKANYYSFFEFSYFTGEDLKKITNVSVYQNTSDATPYGKLFVQTLNEEVCLTTSVSKDATESWPYITLDADNIVPVKELVGEFWRISFAGKKTETPTAERYKVGGVLATKRAEVSSTLVADYIPASEVYAYAPEAQWGVVAYDATNQTVTLQNRESEEKIAGVQFRENEDGTYTMTTTDANVSTVIIGSDLVNLEAADKVTMFDGYKQYSENDVRNNNFLLGQYHGVDGNNHAYFVENHKNSHQIGMTAEDGKADKWNLRFATREVKIDGKKQAVVDTLFITTPLLKLKADGVTPDGKTDSRLAILPYSFQKVSNREFVSYNGATGYKYYYCNEDLTENDDVNEAERFALKMKADGNAYNFVKIVDGTETGDKNLATEDADKLGAVKVKVANSENKGSLKQMDIYAEDENSLMVVEKAESPEYHKISLEWGDTISLARKENAAQVLYEKFDAKSIVEEDTLSFLNIDNINQFNVNPAIFADTAYINRGEGENVNTCYQYLLAVRHSYGYHKENCNNPNHKPEVSAQIDTVYGDFLVNLIDTANVYGANNIHNNWYINEDEAGEDAAKLAFVSGFHTNDTLYIVKAEGDTVKLGMNTPDFNVAKFAFRYTDADAKTFKIQTQWKKYLGGNDLYETAEDFAEAYEKNAADLTSNEGYLKWINGTVVVVEGFDRGDEFVISEEVDRDPTANGAIETSSISVVATNGAVIIKGAEGKKVSISNVLGQTIANTVVTSSEATISAPAGVVVVAVEGEAAVKAIVK